MQPKIVFVPIHGRVLKEDEIDRALASLEEDHPFLLALRQMLQTRWAIASAQSAQVEMTERAAGHAGGRIEDVVSLLEEIKIRRERVQ